MHDDESSRRPTLDKDHLKEKVTAQARYNFWITWIFIIVRPDTEERPRDNRLCAEQAESLGGIEVCSH